MKYTLVLYGKNEFYPKLNNKQYNILLADTKEKTDFMCNFFKNFIKEQNNNIKKKFYIGMDFEFKRVRKTDKDIALFQIILDSNDNNIGTIFVFYPPELNNNQMTILIELLTNEYIIKIIHGGESLDIPYLFDQVFKKEKLIHKFCKNLYDTKYLCEYAHIELDEQKKRCSIYYLLEEYKIITHQKFIDLESIEEKTGPIYLIDIDIHKLNFDVFRYSLYDVLFLPDLIKKFSKKDKIYTNLIPEISHIVFQYKRKINSEGFSFNKMKDITNLYNIHFIELDNKIFTLNEIYQYILFTLYIPEWEQLIKITYFKEFLETILRYLVYHSISEKQIIMVNKNKEATKIPSFNFSKYQYLNILLNKIKIHINKHS